MAKAFNYFFVNLGPNLANKIPDSQTEFHAFLKSRNSQSLFFAPVVEEEIKDIISNLNNKKSSGYDGITNFLLKNIINEIISPLTYILNQSLFRGKVPQKMKIAKVVPIFKKGQKDSVNNYRPISILTSISKMHFFCSLYPKSWRNKAIYTLLEAVRHRSAPLSSMPVHAEPLRMRTNVVYFRVMRRLYRREWNWLCVNQHPWQRTRGRVNDVILQQRIVL